MKQSQHELVKQVFTIAKRIYGDKTPGEISSCGKFIIPTTDSVLAWLPEKIGIPSIAPHFMVINPQIKPFESFYCKLQRRQNEGATNLCTKHIGDDMKRTSVTANIDDIESYLDIRRETNNAPINLRLSIKKNSGYYSAHINPGICEEEQLHSPIFTLAKHFADICFHATREYEAVLKKSDMGVPLTEEDHKILNSLPADEYLRLKSLEAELFAVPSQSMDLTHLYKILDNADKRYNSEAIKPTVLDLKNWDYLNANLAIGNRIDKKLTTATYNKLLPYLRVGQDTLFKRSIEAAKGLKEHKSRRTNLCNKQLQ